MLVLHQMQMSGNSYKVRLAARQLGIPLQLKDYGVHTGETRTPEFLAKNPNGRVPMLELEEGRCLPESGAILFYLADGSRLVPQDKFARAQMLQWMFFEQYSHEPYVAVLRFLRRYLAPGQIDPRRPEDLEPKAYAALQVMETHLAAHGWFAGGSYSIADIALYAYTHTADESGLDLSRFPALTRWLARVRTLPGHIPLSERW